MITPEVDAKARRDEVCLRLYGKTYAELRLGDIDQPERKVDQITTVEND